MLTFRQFLVAAMLCITIAAVPERAIALFQGGPGEGTPWPKSIFGSTFVPVCFRPPGTKTVIDGTEYTITYSEDEWKKKRQLVMDALKASWQKWAKIVFTGGGTCPSALKGRIYVDLIKEDCGGCGNAIPRGYHRKCLQVWMMMENPDERLLRTVVIHEFGHALGFHHEMDRPDAKLSDGSFQCTDGPVEYSEGTYLTPYYDDVSVMNYCAPRNRNGLSTGDIEGSQKLYGTSRAGHWLKALPSLSLYAM